MARKRIVIALLAFATLAACEREATGQVAAVVNGEEITLQEVNAELAGAQVPESADEDVVRRAALERIVERRLLAQAARADGLDSSQDYLIRERQLQDALLVQILGERLERTVAVPDDQDIEAYMRENPNAFSDRKIYTIDRIQFPMPDDFSRLSVLEDDHSMAAVARRLEGLEIEFRRDEGQIDSAAIGQQRLQQLLALPEGEPFVIPENGIVTIGVITGERSEPLSAGDARPLAVRSMRAERMRNSMQQRLAQARESAEIDYQPDFAPIADGETSTAAATE